MQSIALPDFRVAHEPVVETNGESVRCELPVRVLFRDGVHVLGAACSDGVALLGRHVRDSPAIVHAVRTLSDAMARDCRGRT